ncbi:hypothetical protein BLOT_016061 [Blomia tropicalis]|nr:hypothetical protein BLOT_016061 [Blomia tropicalis]
MVLSIIQSRKNGQNKKFLRHSKNYKNTTSSMAKCCQYYMAAKPLIAKIQPLVGKLNKILNEDNFFIGNEFQYENGIIRVKGNKCTKRVPFQFTHSNCKGLLILIEVNEEK